MATVSLQGNKINTNANLPQVGSQAPDFRLVTKDLEDVSLKHYENKFKLISIVPSLDTPVCAASTKKFNEMVMERGDDLTVLIISADLPFAMSRFCSDQGLDNVVPLSMMRSRNFAKDYGVLIEDGPLEGITARAIVVLNNDNRIIYTQLVEEISEEPDYDAAFKAFDTSGQ